MIVLSFESTTFEGKREFHNSCVVFQGTGERDCSISCLLVQQAAAADRRTWQETAVDRLLPRLTAVRV